MNPEATDVEFWFARDSQEPLGFARWVLPERPNGDLRRERSATKEKQ